MPIAYENLELLHHESLTADLGNWHHEGIGRIEPAPEAGMRLHCHGSKQGGAGCMVFFRPTLPDQVAIEYDLNVRSQGGLFINFLAMRGLRDEDMIEQADRLTPRTGVFGDYVARQADLQSFHVSISRFNDAGVHTETSNWRRNPGLILVGHGPDPITEMNRWFRVRITKDAGHCQLEVDGQFVHAFIDRDTRHHPIPDHGKLGFRLIGSDVMADIRNVVIHRIPARDETR